MHAQQTTHARIPTRCICKPTACTLRLRLQGTYAKVKYGQHADSGEAVAIKVLDKERLVQSGMVEQIKREITILKQVSGWAAACWGQSSPYGARKGICADGLQGHGLAGWPAG